MKNDTIMKKRKKRLKYIINFPLQIRIIASSVLIVLFFSLLATGFMAFITHKSYNETEKTLNKLTENLQTEDNIIQSFIKYAGSLNSTRYELRTDKIKNDHEKSMTELSSTINELKLSMNRTKIYFYIFCFIMILQAITFTVYVIRFSQRIAGPIKIMKTILEDIVEGKEINYRTLRKNDELKHFFEVFITTMINITNKKRKRTISPKKKESIEIDIKETLKKLTPSADY